MQQAIYNPHRERLDYSFTPAAGKSARNDWIILLGHGVTGNKDRPVVADTADALNAAGFNTLLFSFAGNGASEGRFQDATISKEVEDLNAVLDAVAAAYPKIAYIGHSMGGAVGVLQASRDSRICALVSLAGMIDTRAFAETEFGDETPDQGVMWEDASCPLSSAFMRDLCQTIETVAPQAHSIQIPWLLLHGTADDVVLPRDTESIKALNHDNIKTLFIEGADHSFGEASHKQALTQAVVDWLITQDQSSHT